LLVAHDLDVEGVDTVVVGPATDFNRMFAEALARRGARVSPPQALPEPAPGEADRPPAPAAWAAMRDRLAGAGLVVLSAGVPHAVPARWLAPGAIALDAGYFNPEGRGDLDTGTEAGDVEGRGVHGLAHLRALAPVPGGLGPMTVSVLVERVIARAGG
jgi:methylenetetrahydrofolate dehydrogenase (NADP+)/methenyltetrahydrofolate cyclohydrolase